MRVVMRMSLVQKKRVKREEWHMNVAMHMSLRRKKHVRQVH